MSPPNPNNRAAVANIPRPFPSCAINGRSEFPATPTIV